MGIRVGLNAPGFAFSALLTMAVIAARAQVPAGVENEATAPDPDVIAAEEFVREIREAAVVARDAVAQNKQDKDVEPLERPVSTEALIAFMKAGRAGSPASLQEQIAEQETRLAAMREHFSEENVEVILTLRRLEQLQAQLEEEQATEP